MSGTGPKSSTLSLLGTVEGAEKLLLSGRRSREGDLENTIGFFLEFLRGFESFDLDRPCVTVFGSARLPDGHPRYELARAAGRELARAGYGVVTGGGPGIMEAANRGARRRAGSASAATSACPWSSSRIRTLIDSSSSSTSSSGR